LATGINAVQTEAILALTRLPDITPELLGLLYDAMATVVDREGVVSVRSVYRETGEQLNMEHLQLLFFALAQAGILVHRKHDRRGYIFDKYQIEREQLFQVMHDAIVALHVLKQVQTEQEQDRSVHLIATLPDSLPLGADVRHSIPSLAASLHRLITEAKREIIVLTPFFEQVGFNRLESALLAAADHGVTITIITQQLRDLTSINHRVLQGLSQKAADVSLSSHFSFYEYQQMNDGRAIMAAHAKILLADGEKAYLGSANLTEHGMARLVEVGVILQGLPVRLLRQIFQAVLSASQTEAIRFSSEEFL
jgi:phosphatidylserine/phosphatidylglycerophosphate/cardiolipin synthase-like enzyme